jgi:hypothetical protein
LKKVFIDSEIARLFPSGFLETELQKHPNVLGVERNRDLTERSPAFWHVREKIIFINPGINGAELLDKLEKNLRMPLSITPEESWIFVFCHELHHSDGDYTESECDFFAAKRLRELRVEAAEIERRKRLRRLMAYVP